MAVGGDVGRSVGGSVGISSSPLSPESANLKNAAFSLALSRFFPFPLPGKAPPAHTGAGAKRFSRSSRDKRSTFLGGRFWSVIDRSPRHTRTEAPEFTRFTDIASPTRSCNFLAFYAMTNLSFALNKHSDELPSLSRRLNTTSVSRSGSSIADG